MAEWSEQEDEVFKRRLIRSMARLRRAGLTEAHSEMWDRVRQEMQMPCDFSAVWLEMCDTTWERVMRLLECGDAPELVPAAERMTRNDWLLLDHVLVHGDIELIPSKSLKNYDKLRPLVQAFHLTQQFHLEQCPRERRAAAWAAATACYNRQGKHSSPMLLQRRWWELKRSTRNHFHRYWSALVDSMASSVGPSPRSSAPALTARPAHIHIAIARRFSYVITEPQMSWSESIECGQVVLPEEFERLSAVELSEYECALAAERERAAAKDDDDVPAIEPLETPPVPAAPRPAARFTVRPYTKDFLPAAVLPEESPPAGAPPTPILLSALPSPPRPASSPPRPLLVDTEPRSGDRAATQNSPGGFVYDPALSAYVTLPDDAAIVLGTLEISRFRSTSKPNELGHRREAEKSESNEITEEERERSEHSLRIDSSDDDGTEDASDSSSAAEEVEGMEGDAGRGSAAGGAGGEVDEKLLLLPVVVSTRLEHMRCLRGAQLGSTLRLRRRDVRAVLRESNPRARRPRTRPPDKRVRLPDMSAVRAANSAVPCAEVTPRMRPAPPLPSPSLSAETLRLMLAALQARDAPAAAPAHPAPARKYCCLARRDRTIGDARRRMRLRKGKSNHTTGVVHPHVADECKCCCRHLLAREEPPPPPPAARAPSARRRRPPPRRRDRPEKTKPGPAGYDMWERERRVITKYGFKVKPVGVRAPPPPPPRPRRPLTAPPGALLSLRADVRVLVAPPLDPRDYLLQVEEGACPLTFGPERVLVATAGASLPGAARWRLAAPPSPAAAAAALPDILPHRTYTTVVTLDDDDDDEETLGRLTLLSPLCSWAEVERARAEGRPILAYGWRRGELQRVSGASGRAGVARVTAVPLARELDAWLPRSCRLAAPPAPCPQLLAGVVITVDSSDDDETPLVVNDSPVDPAERS